MINKTNLMAVAIIAAAAFTAAPAANATVAAGMSAATAASTMATTTTAPAPAGIVLAHGWGHGGWGGHGWGGGHWGHGGHRFRKCRWLKRKARRTGRRHWWRKYYRCRNRFY